MSIDLKQTESLIFKPESYIDRMDFADVFPDEKPVEVEIGSGDGSFLVEYARRREDLNFIGVERLLGRLRKIDKRSRRAGVANVRVLRLEANYLVQYLLPLAGVAAVHIYFPDPWPKKRHFKNRLIQPDFVKLLERVLVPGGIIYLRTDHVEYFEQMLEVFAENPNFTQTETPEALRSVITDFERGFQAEGKATNLAAYALKAKNA